MSVKEPFLHLFFLLNRKTQWYTFRFKFYLTKLNKNHLPNSKTPGRSCCKSPPYCIPCWLTGTCTG